MIIAAEGVKADLKKVNLELDDLREKAQTLSSETCSLRSSLSHIEKLNVDLAQSNHSLEDQNASLTDLARKWQEVIISLVEMIDDLNGSRRDQVRSIPNQIKSCLGC